LDLDGHVSLDTVTAGPQRFKFDMDPSDVSDAMDSAIGLGGYATDGKWVISYSFSTFELEGDQDNASGNLDVKYKFTWAEAMLGYPVYKTPDVKLGVIGGVVYTEHDFTSNFFPVAGGKIRNNKKNDWTDVAIGLTLDVPINKEWTWANMARGEFGDSEGGYTAKTGFNWAINKTWSTSFSVKAQAVDYENGDEGDADWYHYDVDQTSAAIGFLYNW